MKKYLLIVYVLFLTACGANNMPTAQATANIAPKAIQVIATAIATETPVPTATIDTQATIAYLQQQAQSAQQEAYQAQAQADAAKRLMVDATVTHEAVMLIAAQMTQESAVLAAKGTQMAINATASVYPTSIPLTATQQVMLNSVRSTQQAANDPKFIQNRADADAYAKNAGNLLLVAIALKWSIAVFVIALSAALVILIWRNGEPTAAENATVPNLDPIPFAVDASNKDRLIRAEVPCSNEQITDLSNGILHMKMTLGFNQWQGTSVHKSLKEIRDFFQEHKFAKLIPGKSGELILTSEGEEFLIECWTLKEPPLPFRCIAPSPRSINGSKLAPVI